MSLALVPGGGGAISYREHVENLAKEAYRSCLRVFSVGQLDWNKEHLLTNLRKELGIDNSVHTILLDETLSDPELGNIREVYGQGRQDQLYPGSGGSFRQHPKAKRLEDGFQGDMHMAQPIAPGHRPGAIMARTLKPPGPPSGAPGPLLGGPGGEKRGPGRPRVSGTGLAINLGVQGQQRMKVHGSKKHGPGLARQNSLISEATASIGGPPPPPAVPEINEYIGWTVLRYWPDEVDGPWVRGLITDYHADVDEHAIVYNFEEEDESFEMFRFRDHKAGVDYRLEGLSQVFSLRGPGHTGGRGTRGTLRGRGGRSRGGRHGGGRPLSAGRSPRKDVFLPRRMPPSTETLEFILRQPLEEADVRVLMARLDERQEQLHAELELLARLEDDDQDEETLRQLWQQSLDMKEAACKLELQDLDEEEKFWASR